MTETKDIRLIIKIENKQPVELLDLTKSLVSVATQFNSYASTHGDSKENREAKLYVKEIKTGSIVLELIEMATVGVLPFLENINTIVGFADYIKKVYSFLLGKTKEKPKELTKSDYKDLSQIVNPIANDNGSQMNISTTVNGDVHLHYHLNSLEANAIQNVIDKEEKKLKEPESDGEAKTKVLLTWYQARNDMNSNIGNKGIIEDLSPRPMNIIIEDDGLKDKMLHGENPFTTAFVVDVKLLHANGRLSAYKVTHLHDSFDTGEAT